MLVHPMVGQRKYPCEQNPSWDPSLEDPEGASITLTGPRPSSCDTGHCCSFLDLFFAMCLMGEVLSAGGIMVTDTILGFPRTVAFSSPSPCCKSA